MNGTGASEIDSYKKACVIIQTQIRPSHLNEVAVLSYISVAVNYVCMEIFVGSDLGGNHGSCQ